jgi:hypothetical protein
MTTPVRGPMLDANDVRARLDEIDYLVDDGMATALFLALTLQQPLLLEGEPGVGKTTAAKALARAMGAPLIRLQCHEGLTAGEALYEWNYQRLLLAIRLAESRHQSLADADLFTEEFLQERPILKAIRTSGPVAPVLLIDEIDRADDEFEALLFEFLGEASITIPESGTFVAELRPVVVLTSNRSREGARWTLTRRPGWPRPSTGCPPSPLWAPPIWCAPRSFVPSARSPRHRTTAIPWLTRSTSCSVAKSSRPESNRRGHHEDRQRVHDERPD